MPSFFAVVFSFEFTLVPQNAMICMNFSSPVKEGVLCMERTANDFSRGSIARHILNLAVPMTVAQLTVVLYNIVDRAFIGHIENVGKTAFTGIGLVMPVICIITAFSNLSGMGGAPLFSIARGKQDTEEASRIMGNAFSFLLVLGVLLMAFFYVFLEPILFLVGGSAETVPFALDYARIYLLGTLPVMISLGMNPFINAQGFGRTGMITVVLGAVINIILDPIFIFGFDLGVKGAALATVLSQIISAVWVLRFLTGQRALLPLRKSAMRLQGKTILKISSLGLTGFTFSLTGALVQSCANALLQTYGSLAGGVQTGDLYVGVMTALTSIQEVVMQPGHGLTRGAQPVIGYNYGAKAYDRVHACIRFEIKAVFAYMAVIWILLLLFPGFWISIFNDDPSLLAAGSTAIRIHFALYVLMGCQLIGQSTFVALGYARHAVFFSLLRKAILVIPLMFLLPNIAGLGVYGVFLAEPISDLVGGGLCFITMLLTTRKKLQSAQAE